MEGRCPFVLFTQFSRESMDEWVRGRGSRAKRISTHGLEVMGESVGRGRRCSYMTRLQVHDRSVGGNDGYMAMEWV